MAAALRSLASPSNPNPSPNSRIASPSRPLPRLPSPHLFFRSAAALPAGRADRDQPPRLWTRCLGDRVFVSGRRFPLLVPLAAPNDESKHSDIEVEKEKNDLETKTHESEEAWKQTAEAFKEEAIKMKDMSAEAYAIFSKKAMVILKEASEKLKIQADKARYDLTVLAKEISEDGNDCVKDVVETFSSAENIRDISEVRDFHVGIPYGSFLAIGGFLSFMLTESISAIRFGLILGAALLYVSYSSLRTWKNGQSSEMFLLLQTAIAAILFFQGWQLFLQRRSLPTFLVTLISGAVLVFYIYRIYHGYGKGPRSRHGSEN